MKDYGREGRRCFIASVRMDGETPKQHFQRLMSENFEEHVAAQISGWHPIVPVDAFLRRLSWTMIVGSVVILLFMFVGSTNAAMNIPDYQRTESALIECLNGGVVKLDDGSEFICVRTK